MQQERTSAQSSEPARSEETSEPRPGNDRAFISSSRKDTIGLKISSPISRHAASRRSWTPSRSLRARIGKSVSQRSSWPPMQLCFWSRRTRGI